MAREWDDPDHRHRCEYDGAWLAAIAVADAVAVATGGGRDSFGSVAVSAGGCAAAWQEMSLMEATENGNFAAVAAAGGGVDQRPLARRPLIAPGWSRLT